MIWVGKGKGRESGKVKRGKTKEGSRREVKGISKGREQEVKREYVKEVRRQIEEPEGEAHHVFTLVSAPWLPPLR